MSHNIPMPDSVWTVLAELLLSLKVVWPEALARLDLTFWQSQVAAGLARAVPGRTLLSRRWRWSEHRAARFAKANVATTPPPLNGAMPDVPPGPTLLSGPLPAAAHDLLEKLYPPGGHSPIIAGQAANETRGLEQPPLSQEPGPGVPPVAEVGPHAVPVPVSGASRPSFGPVSPPRASAAGPSPQTPSLGSAVQLDPTDAAPASHRPADGLSPGSRSSNARHDSASSSGTAALSPAAHRPLNGTPPATHRINPIRNQTSNHGTISHDASSHIDTIKSAPQSAATFSRQSLSPAKTGTSSAISSLSSLDLSIPIDPVRDQKKEKKEGPPIEVPPPDRPAVQVLMRLLERWSGPEAPRHRRWLVQAQDDLRWFLTDILSMKETLSLNLVEVLNGWDEWLERTARSPDDTERNLFPRHWKTALRSQIKRQAAWLEAKAGDLHDGIGRAKMGHGVSQYSGAADETGERRWPSSLAAGGTPGGGRPGGERQPDGGKRTGTGAGPDKARWYDDGFPKTRVICAPGQKPMDAEAFARAESPAAIDAWIDSRIKVRRAGDAART